MQVTQDQIVTISDMHSFTLVPKVTYLYPPKLVLLGKDKKGNIVNLMWKICHKCMCMMNHQL